MLLPRAAFALSFLFFLLRGPYRALHASVSIDFAVNYASSRLWLQGRNPYDPALLKAEFIGPARGPAAIAPKYATQPAVYPPTMFALIAPIAWLPWNAANWIWCLASTALVLLSLRKILAASKLPVGAYWAMAAALTAFSPTHTGLAMGNPSAVACALTTLAALAALEERETAAGLLTGAAVCLKPQIAICAVALFLAWRKPRAVVIAAATAAGSAAISLLRAPSWEEYLTWLQTLRANVSSGFFPGGANDASIANPVSFLFINVQALLGLLIRDATFLDAAAWIILAALFIVYAKRRTGSRDHDVAFAAVMTLLAVYHRYYDAQLLLLVVPFLAAQWKRRESRWLLGLLCAFAFPLQTALAAIPAAALLLRHQPLALLLAAVLLSAWPRQEVPT
jgi:hypothetical protein